MILATCFCIKFELFSVFEADYELFRASSRLCVTKYLSFRDTVRLRNTCSALEVVSHETIGPITIEFHTKRDGHVCGMVHRNEKPIGHHSGELIKTGYILSLNVPYVGCAFGCHQELKRWFSVLLKALLLKSTHRQRSSIMWFEVCL